MVGVQASLMDWFVGAGSSNIRENEDLRPVLSVKRRAYAYYGNWSEREVVEAIEDAIRWGRGKGAEVVILSKKVKVRPIGLKDPKSFYYFLEEVCWIPFEVKTVGSWIILEERP